MRRAIGTAITLSAASVAACFSTPAQRSDAQSQHPGDAPHDTPGNQPVIDANNSVDAYVPASGSCVDIAFAANATAGCGGWASPMSGTAAGSGVKIEQNGGVLYESVATGSGASSALCASPAQPIDSVLFDVRDAFSQDSPPGRTFIGVTDGTAEYGVELYRDTSSAVFTIVCPTTTPAPFTFTAGTTRYFSIARQSAAVSIQYGSTASTNSSLGICNRGTTFDNGMVIIRTERDQANGPISALGPATQVGALQICAP